MSIRMGTLVTLLVNKEHPDGDDLSSGVSGLVVQEARNGDGSLRYVVDFGSEGQWNCEESELEQEGSTIGEDGPEREREVASPAPEGANLSSDPALSVSVDPHPVGYERKKIKEEEHVLSFEEEMAMLERE